MQKEQWQDGTGNYLKIALEQGENYSEKIFLYQEVKGFLPMEIRRINGKSEAIYNISGKISLRTYLEEKEFTREDIRALFFQLFDMADIVEEYLLDSEGILLDVDNLYIDRYSGEVDGIYRDADKKSFAESFGCLLETIMEKMNQQDKELVFFIYGMHKKTKEYCCTKEILRQYVTDVQEEKIETEDSPTEMEMRPMEERKGISVSDKKIIIRGCLLPGMILAAGVTLPSVLWWMGMFQKPLSGEMDWVKLIAAVVFFLGVALYGVWKTMPSQENCGKKKIVFFHKEEEEQLNVCLIPQKGREEPIPIKEFPYWFGKSIGEIRAGIFQEKGTVLIMDEESREGTFHNDKRLLPWQKIPLQDGDLLSVEGREYVVEITQAGYVI